MSTLQVSRTETSKPCAWFERVGIGSPEVRRRAGFRNENQNWKRLQVESCRFEQTRKLKQPYGVGTEACSGCPRLCPCSIFSRICSSEQRIFQFG